MADAQPPLTRLQRYLDSLPQGFDSYPEQQHKGAVVRQFLQDQPMAADAHRLPGPLARLVTAPPLSTGWVSEVLAHAMYVAACDLYFKDDQAFIDHSRETNRRLLGGPFFRALFQLVPVAKMLQGAAWRWEQFHRGSTLRVLSSAPGRAELALEFPANLFPEPMPACYATALQVAIEACGVRGASMQVAERSDTRVLYRGSWS